MISRLEYGVTWYTNSATKEVAIYLNKPFKVEDLKRLYPNLKGISFEFAKGEFRALKERQNEYFKEVLEAFDLEEVLIDEHSFLEGLPSILFKPSLKRLSIHSLGKTDEKFELNIPSYSQIEAVSLHCNHIKPNSGLFELPNLKHLELYLCEEAVDLSKSEKLEKLTCTTQSSELGWDTSKMPNLKELNVWINDSEIPVKTQLDFQHNRFLEKLSLRGFDYFPKNLGKCSALRSVWLTNVGQPSSSENFIFSSLDNLEELYLNKCGLDYSPDRFLGSMPNLHKLSILNTEGIVQLRAELFRSMQLTEVELQNCSLPKDMPEVAVDSLETNYLNTENISSLSVFKKINLLSSVQSNLGQAEWKHLISLEDFSLKRCHNVKVLPCFSESNSALKTVELKENDLLETFPESWKDCPAIKSLFIDRCPNLVIPAWDSFSELESLCIDSKVSKIPASILLWNRLATISISENCLRKEVALYVSDLTKVTLDDNLKKETKQLIGLLLFENYTKQHIIDKKRLFLDILNCKSFNVRQYALSRLDLINEPFEVNMDFLKEKTIGILGKVQNAKTYYKNKLSECGLQFKSKIDNDVDVLIVGTNFDLPEEFTSKQRFYISENQIEKFVQDVRPGYIQNLETPELQSLRNLIFSNQEENDRLVLEMVKGGGVAEALLPDLMVVAKTSRVDSVKNGLKKLLKAKLSADAQKILSDRTNMRLYGESQFNYYHSLDPEFDVAQMAYTFVQRENADPKFFLNTFNSSKNQFREEMFLGYYKRYLEKPHYLTIREKLTSDEMRIVLSMPEFKGLLKRLIIYTDEDVSGYIDALLLHKDTLQELHFTTTSSKLIDDIGHLKKIKKFSINGKKLEKLSEGLLQMKKLKELLIYSDQLIIEDVKFKELNKIEHFYCSGNIKFQE
ncbi:hypothetical protein [uncultured Acetobacteroides sp.]|uniref:hypothetical protein n=1 Tax=uncultured Acetobacteroides sp. TaxID=1760811 RepID=UPI0029F5AB44|nr:hypothetical protein [uncultured Acetobacteroides sp.]